MDLASIAANASLWREPWLLNLEFSCSTNRLVRSTLMTPRGALEGSAVTIGRRNGEFLAFLTMARQEFTLGKKRK